ncbi:MAG: hypothetical protein QNJ70_20705 [Xenococcaceae cyanobacterium MO_207.B15]|nr:hypothetical protein [Xenococcaceae cyanobacterium MO_207.B15]
MNTQKRRSRANISIRLQPNEGSSLAKIAQWLNTMSIEKKNNIVSHLLVMTCLPLAIADAGASQEEIEKYYWEFENWLYFYRFTLRERLNIQGKCVEKSEPTTTVAKPFETGANQATSFDNKEVSKTSIEQHHEEKEEFEKVTFLKSQLIGGGKVKNAGSLFDGLG